jgi:acyl-CoA thioesterase FadM
MPDPNMVSLHPRYFECDSNGELHTASWVRWMLQAAIEAGAAADLSALGLDAAGWLEHVGDIGLQIVQPVAFGETIDMQTKVSWSGPPTWRRTFTFQRSGATVAVGFVDAFDEAEEQTVEDDDSDMAAEQSPAWDGPVSDPPDPPRRAFHAVWSAGWQHLDISGLVDPAGLTQMLDSIESRAAEAHGWGAERDQEHGIAWRVSEHRLELFEPIRDGDELKISSYIGDVGDDYMVRHALIERKDDGLLNEVARARTRWACISTATVEPCPIPDGWIDDMADQMTE